MSSIKKIIYLIFIVLPLTLKAAVQIRIDEGYGKNIENIAIFPFKWTGLDSLPENLDKIISNDLNNSNRFSVKIFNIPNNAIEISEDQIKFYQKNDINYVISGSLMPHINKKYFLFYKLTEISKNKYFTILQNKIIIDQESFRSIAHKISNEVFERLTDTRSIFNTKIAYVLYQNSDKYPYKLVISDYDGYNPICIHHSSQPLMSPSWSPDGKKLAFVTFETGHAILVIQNLSTGKIKKIVDFPRHNGAPSWSPDGKKLAFASSKTGKLHLYIYDIHLNNIRQITYGNNNNTEPSWFPNNEYLAYTSDKDGRPQIYKLNIYNYECERISWKEFSNQNANVSKDGNFIAMVNINSDMMQNIAILNLKTGITNIITNTYIDENPSFSPDSNMLIYSSSEKLNSKLNLISFDGKNSNVLNFRNSQGRFPAWSP